MGRCLGGFQLFVVGWGVPCESPFTTPHSLHCSQMDQRSSRAIELDTQVDPGGTQMAHVDPGAV